MNEGMNGEYLWTDARVDTSFLFKWPCAYLYKEFSYGVYKRWVIDTLTSLEK